MSRYKEIMRKLHPLVIIRMVEYPNDSARGMYSLKSSIVASYDEFISVVIDYLKHHSSVVYGIPYNDISALGKAQQILKDMKKAAYMALSGSDGGMNLVLDELNKGFKEEQRRAYFDYIVDKLLDPLDYEDIVGFMMEFKANLEQFAPASFSYVSAAAMAADYKSILWKYIEAVSQYKNLYKYY